MPAIKEAQKDILPNPLPLINGTRPSTVGGGVFQHIYAANGKPTLQVPLAGPDEVDAAPVGRWVFDAGRTTEWTGT
jgi:hypothetical protein